MTYQEYFTEDGWLKEEYLWPLRKQITLGSLYISDYRNSFGIAPEKVCDFFTSFWDSYTEELAKEDHLWEQAVREVQLMVEEDPEEYKGASPSYFRNLQDRVYMDLCSKEYDNERTLLEWYGCFVDDCPLPANYVNVDIHWDFARSIRVIAEDEDDAEGIVDEMMRKGEIPQSSFEATGDWELDTTYQPD